MEIVIVSVFILIIIMGISFLIKNEIVYTVRGKMINLVFLYNYNLNWDLYKLSKNLLDEERYEYNHLMCKVLFPNKRLKEFKERFNKIIEE